MPVRETKISICRNVKSREEDCWLALSSADGAAKWLEAAEYVMPADGLGPFRWAFRHGPRVHVYSGESTVSQEHHTIEMVWPLCSIEHDTVVRITFASSQVSTDVRVVQSGFPDTPLGRVEADLHEHHWGHILDALSMFLGAGTHRGGHPAITGIVPMGAAPPLGLVVKDVLPGSPADDAGIGAGDIIRTLDGADIGSMDEFDAWLDARKPGQIVRVVLIDRACELKLGRPSAIPELAGQTGDAWTSTPALLGP
jgi:hypothetical protein